MAAAASVGKIFALAFSALLPLINSSGSALILIGPWGIMVQIAGGLVLASMGWGYCTNHILAIRANWRRQKKAGGALNQKIFYL